MAYLCRFGLSRRGCLARSMIMPVARFTFASEGDATPHIGVFAVRTRRKPAGDEVYQFQHYTFRVSDRRPSGIDSDSCSPSFNTLRLLCDPAQNDKKRHSGDCQSRRYESKLSVTYRQHPQKDGLPVVGEVAFPNLDFEYTKVGGTGVREIRVPTPCHVLDLSYACRQE